MFTGQAQSIELELEAPKVDCWFAADFDDHVYLQTDFHSLFGFLPELVRMYMKTQVKTHCCFETVCWAKISMQVFASKFSRGIGWRFARNRFAIECQ